MAENKTKPTKVSVDTFLSSIDPRRKEEAKTLIGIMQKISAQKPVMWGPSIIGFGSQHYKYDTGREGDMPQLGFSPRKGAITVYFSEGFEHYTEELKSLGKFKSSVSCLYINKLEDVDLKVLEDMIKKSYRINTGPQSKPSDVKEYIDQLPQACRVKFDELRSIVKKELPAASEVLSYGIVGYKIDDKRARVFVSGWKDHVSMYPVPADAALQTKLKPYIKGKGTLWFSLDKDLPTELIKKTVRALVS